MAPDLDPDVEAPDAFAIIAGVLLLDVGVTMAGALGPTPVFAIASMYVFGTAVVCIGAGITDVDLQKWGRPLAAGALIALAAVLGVTWLAVRPAQPETDVLAFQAEAARLTLEGTNPYTAELGAVGKYPTPQLDGSTVSTFSYPSGTILATLPTTALGIDRWGRLPIIVAGVGLGALLINDAQPETALLGFLAIIVDDLVAWGVIGLNDPLWLLPFALSLRWLPGTTLAPDKLVWSAVAIGVAVSMKQTPWFATPFIAIWVTRAVDVRGAIKYVGVATAIALVLSLPFVLSAPGAYLGGALTPLFGSTATPVHTGIGLSSLTVSGTYAVHKTGHTVLVVLAALAGLIWYWRDFDRMKHLGWIAWAPLLLLHYRSFPSYAITAVPIAAYAYMDRKGAGACD